MRAISTKRCSRDGSTTSATSGGVIDFNRQRPRRRHLRLDLHAHRLRVSWDGLACGHADAAICCRTAFTKPGGDALRRWIDECPNGRYSSALVQGADAWRTQLIRDLGDAHGIRALLDEHDDRALHRLMTNLGGHDLPALLDAFHGVLTIAPRVSSPTRSRNSTYRLPATRTTTPG